MSVILNEIMKKSFSMLTSIRALSLVMSLNACSLMGLVDGAALPHDVLDPEAIRTEKGAIALYNNTLYELSSTFAGEGIGSTDYHIGNYGSANIIRLVGFFTDELVYEKEISTGTSEQLLLSVSLRRDGVDGRLFHKVSQLRTTANLAARVILGLHNSSIDSLAGHAMIVEAFTEILLADMFCSGIPLSTFVDGGDVNITRGYSTEEVYRRALDRLDSALLLVESSGFADLANTLKIRANLALGNIEEAADLSPFIRPDFHFFIDHRSAAFPTRKNFAFGIFEKPGNLKGGKGLPFRTSDDPRVQRPEYTNMEAPHTMADALEARLAEAEAALAKDDSNWLTILNALRTSCTSSDNCPTPAPRGVGGIAGLQLLEDPGTGEGISATDAHRARLILLFEERAYWLYLRGTRNGDLRRMIRNYGFDANEVYPVGISEIGEGTYGDYSNMMVPDSEKLANDNFNGCIHRDA